jgi:hypothetical protein
LTYKYYDSVIDRQKILIKNTCLNAVGGGHLEVLKWAEENECNYSDKY